MGRMARYVKKRGHQFDTAVTFEHDDRCGDSQTHAQELDEFIQELKRENNADKINIVAHSKGGLDAKGISGK